MMDSISSLTESVHNILQLGGAHALMPGATASASLASFATSRASRGAGPGSPTSNTTVDILDVHALEETDVVLLLCVYC